jgi:hypothetical protein
MKQTSVEYLVEQLKEYDFSPRDNTFLIEIPLWIWKEKVEQAKEMEKQQIIDAFNDSRILLITNDCSSGRQYYNENYKSE